MNILLNNIDRLYEVKSTPAILRAQFDQVARDAWKSYRAEVEARSSLFEPLRESYFGERNDEPFVIPLNSHIPVMLSEVFGENDSAKMTAIAIGHLYLDTFTQVLDDVADTVGHDNEQVHLSHLLLMEGMHRLSEVTSGSLPALRRMQEAVEDTMAAERALWSHKRSVQPYSEGDFEVVSRRGGILRCAVRAYAAITGKEEVASIAETGLLKGALAVQLVDDLLDWDDDLRDEIYTAPLATALLALGKHSRREVSFDDVARSLIESGAVDQTLERASVALHEGRRIFESIGGYSLAGLFGSLQFRVEELQQEIKHFAATRALEINKKNFHECLKRSGDTRLMH